MPSEDGELWNAVRKRGQEKRAKNRAYGPDRLRDEGYEPEERNGGAHLIVRPHTGSPVIDYWPGTGLWKQRGMVHPRRGIAALLKHLHDRDGGSHA